MKLIDKDAVVAEIERRKEVNFKQSERFKHSKESLISRVSEDVDILCFLDTIEVKDVDLEEKATQLSQKYFPDEENIWARSNIEAQRCKSACIEMVEWLKAQKGE